MNLPNLITTLRLLLLPVFLTLLVYRRPIPALAVLVAAALSDALDGLVARRLNQKTSIGSFLDPLADKLLSVCGFVTLSFLGPIPAWFVIMVISRDVIISLGSLVLYLHDGRLQIAPSLTGKTATLCQFLSLVLTLVVQITGDFETPWFWLLGATAALTVVSGIQYLWRGLAHAGTRPAA